MCILTSVKGQPLVGVPDDQLCQADFIELADYSRAYDVEMVRAAHKILIPRTK